MQSNKSSIFHQSAKLMNVSRGSQLTSLGESGSRINTSFDLDISIISNHHSRNLSLLSSTTPIRAKIAEKKIRNKLDHSKKNYITKVLVNRALNIRQALKKMESIPTSLFKKGVHFDMASLLIMKSKANLQASVMRTLFYDLNDKVITPSKLKMEQGSNVFVLPTTLESTQGKTNAIIKFNGLLTDNLRQIVKKFEAHRKNSLILKRYLSKYLSNFLQKRKAAMFMLKMLPESHYSSYGEVQLNKLVLIAAKIQERALRWKMQAFNSIALRNEVIEIKKKHIAKLIVMCSKLRKEEGFRFWKTVSFQRKRQDEEQIKTEESKLSALRRIVQRNYFKLFKEISRRIFTTRKAAIRLGCCSKINQQKSLWRLLINAKISKK